MHYHVAKQLSLFLSIVIGCLVLGCSNSEGVDYAGWEYAYDDTDGVIEPGKQDCFNSFRLPDLQSIACKKKFFSSDTIKDFPQSGFFSKTFTIAFPNNKPLNCEIGGKPVSKESPLVSAIQVDSSMTIRCADFSENAASTEIIRTYILEKNPDIAAVFLTTDPNSLFDPDTGIYMEGPNAEEKEPHYGANYWLDKEIPVFIEFIEKNQNTPAFAKHAGLKIFGKWSRMKAKKSVSITFREKYGTKRLYYPLFPEFPELKVFKSFVLRNNGQNFEKDYIRDRLISSITEGLGVDYQRGRFAIVYYNSQYFGIHDLRERSNEYYFETHYGINHNNINLVDAKNKASAGSAADFIALMNWIKNNSLDDDQNYAYVCSLLNIDNFINYMQIEMFANNRDWPGNNQKKWNRSDVNTPWKWFLYDLDWSFGNGNGPTKNIFEYASSEIGDDWINGPTYTLLFRSLLKNKKFKNAFINRMAALLQMNFEYPRIQSSINTLMNEIKSEIPKDQKKWSLDPSKMEKTLEHITNFAIERPSVIIQELQEHFKLASPTQVTLSKKGQGYILIHDLPLDKVSTTIDFFEGHPVTITAKPSIGYTWSSWSDGETSQTRTIWPEETKDLTAIFK